MKKEDKIYEWKSLFKALPVILLCIFMPIIMFIFVNVISLFFEIINSSFSNHENIAQNIFFSLKPNEINDSTWKEIALNNQFKPLNFEEYKNLQISSSTLLFFPSIAGITISIILFKTLIELSTKTFQHFFLFIISPFVFITITYDRGEKFRIWKELFIFKIFVIFAFLIGIQIFTLYSGVINKWINTLKIDSFSKKIFLLITLIGGALATKELIKICSKVMGERQNFKELFYETKMIIKESTKFYKNNESQENSNILEKIRFNYSKSINLDESKFTYFKENFVSHSYYEPFILKKNSINKDSYYKYYQKLVNNNVTT